jgi:hypothetical protein
MTTPNRRWRQDFYLVMYTLIVLLLFATTMSLIGYFNTP